MPDAPRPSDYLTESATRTGEMLDFTSLQGRHIDARLYEEPIIWLATVRADGPPHVVPRWFLWDRITVLLYTSPHGEEVQNIRHDARVTLALDGTNRGIDVVVIEGVAELLTAPEAAFPPAAYFEKYAATATRFGPGLERADPLTQPIRIRPQRLITW